MAAPATTQDHWTIGRWRFDATLGSLSDGPDIRRLEHRAAATLALLCRRRGEVVARHVLLDEIWQGRAVSANSVAVVIADLRRALDDDAKAPKFLTTVTKRGYRLVPDVASPLPAPARDRRNPWPALIVGLLLAAFLIAIVTRGLVVGPAPRRLSVYPVRNETGQPADAALATALSALVVDQLAQTDAVAVTQAASPTTATANASDLVLSAKLVLWNGTPTLHMLATERVTGRVIWSGMAVADADHIAGETISRLADLKARLQTGAP